MYYNYMYRNWHTRQDQRHEINVSGYDVQFILPDKSVVILSIVTKGEGPLKTEMENKKALDLLLKQLGEFGVKKEDITVDQEFQRPIIDEEQGIVSYQSASFIKVSFYDVASLTEFLYNLRGSNINIVEIVYSIDDLSKYYSVGLEKALLKATKKAKTLANAMGAQLSDLPIVIRETSNIADVVNRIVSDASQVGENNLELISVAASLDAKFLIEE